MAKRSELNEDERPKVDGLDVLPMLKQLEPWPARTVMIMRFQLDWSCRQISEATELPIEEVEQIIRRSLDHLKSLQPPPG